ncbi:hypothetical protein [Paenibacillus sp. oral taxon 786]|uniref:hypothetical protein n=1 Tax=Paenibacillus sp. oral taxon 786 TaxID=652715 RepID=UPI00055FCBB0|nr:hypothetical protein [Paenibacillus sp. oral taxon 786]
MDALLAAKMRIISRACVTRFAEGKLTMNEIVSYYNLSNENAEYVKAEIIKILPDINFEL